MKNTLKLFFAGAAVCALTTAALAKLPAPSDDAKAKAAEAAAKAAWAGKVDAYQLCKSQDRVAAHAKKAKLTEKDAKAAAKAPASASACVDPGPFVYTPAAPAAPASSAAPVAAPAAPAASAKK